MVETREQGPFVFRRLRDIVLVLAVALPLLCKHKITLERLTLDVQGLKSILLR